MTSGRPDASGTRPSPQRNRPSGTPTLRGADADGRDRTSVVVSGSETIRLPYGLTAVVHLRKPHVPTTCAACDREPSIWTSPDGTPLCARCVIDGVGR